MKIGSIGWIALIVGFVIQLVFAVKYGQCAEDKGHDRTVYFWICLIFGIVGYCLVAALPDLCIRNMLERQRAPEGSIIKNATVVAPASNGNWRCYCGRENAGYVSSCVCGINKRDL